MKVRLVVTINAVPGKGAELAQAFRQRCADVATEPGCEQFEVFQSVLNPDKLTLLELWSDQAALDTHAKVNATRAPTRLAENPGKQRPSRISRLAATKASWSWRSARCGPRGGSRIVWAQAALGVSELANG